MLIHSSGGVYYHYQLIFLSKLTHRGITRFLFTAPKHRFAWLTDWRHSRWPARVHLSAGKRDASFASRKTARSRRRWRCDTSNRTDGHASSCKRCWVYRKRGRRTPPRRDTLHPACIAETAICQQPGQETGQQARDRCLHCRQNGFELQRLWKNACISTGASVQKQTFFWLNCFCPTSVQHRYNVFPALTAARKPLTL